MKIQRPIALVTGAAGGMGRACARQLGRHYDLALNDIDAPHLLAFADMLREDGYSVVGVEASDFSTPGAAQTFVDAVRRSGPIRAVAHTAGISSRQGEWRAVLGANLITTERLLVALECAIEPGLVAVLIASMAAHMIPPNAVLDEALADPLHESLFDRAQPILQALSHPQDPRGLSSPAYAGAKRAVVRICERRARAWGAQGARITSISPGMIWTSMGREAADGTPAVQSFVDANPVGGWGTSTDIANAVEFLVSDLARYVTGCDLRIDGGVTPATRGPTF
jgi:NAD(P)-dependent dehydrogenase (short-subunit alcohol dehydrogenase family)